MNEQYFSLTINQHKQQYKPNFSIPFAPKHGIIEKRSQVNAPTKLAHTFLYTVAAAALLYVIPPVLQPALCQMGMLLDATTDMHALPADSSSSILFFLSFSDSS
jgi:hypothetical protein